MIDRLLDNLFAFDSEETTGEILFYRLFEVLIGAWVIFFVWSWAPYIQRLTDVVLPLGVANYLDIAWFFEGSRTLVVAAIATITFLLGFFRIWKWGYLIALLAFHIQYASRYTLGEISHGSNVIGIVLFCMALASLSFAGARDRRRASLGFAFFFLGFGYTSASICKLIATGPLWVDGAHLWMWIAERYVDTFSIYGTASLNMLQEAAVNSYPLATLILTFGLVTEFFGFLMWYRRTRMFIVILLLGMHVGILISMNINFPANNALLIAFALPYAALLDRWIRSLPEQTRGRVARLAERIA